MAFLGIEIGGTKLQVAVVSAAGVVTATARGAVAAASGAAAVLDVVERLVAEAVPLAREPLEAVGIGFGGPVDRVRGTVAASHQVTGWSGFPLLSWVAERTGLPTTLENDSNAAALAEAVVGAGRGFHAVVYSNVGSGVGGGLVVGGRIYHGRVPGEMEIGHLRLAIDGPIVEDVVSGWSLDQQVRAVVEANPHGGLALAAAGMPPSARCLGPAIAAGDAEATAIVDRAARSYALGLSHAVQLLNPDAIVLGGGVAGIGEPWRAAVAAHLHGFVVEALRPPPPVLLAALGDFVVPVGAALMACFADKETHTGRT
jgi:glucokinase